MDVKGCRRKNISASTENEKGIEKKNYLLKLIKKEQVMLNHSFNIKILSFSNKSDKSDAKLYLQNLLQRLRTN